MNLRRNSGNESDLIYSPISTIEDCDDGIDASQNWVSRLRSQQQSSLDSREPAAAREHRSYPNIQSIREKMEYKLFDVIRNRSIIVDILTLFFGIGTWLGVNGTFIQLPLLVAEAAEGWSLPSYLSIMVQIGNLGPLVYTIIQMYSKHKVNDAIAIYVMLALGSISLLLTSFFYNRTAYLFGSIHSIALFILTVCTAINACTSSVLFMPYMGRFKEKYIVTYFIGEGLSGLLPSIVALIQGVGSIEKCVLVNVTESGEEIFESKTVPPVFSTKVFFLILFFFMMCSLIGFIMLNNLSVVKKEYTTMSVARGHNYVYESDTHQESPKETAADSTVKQISATKYWALVLLTAIISFFANGIFGSIQSYSALPYGLQAYHLSATLSVIANPLACFLAMFLSFTSLRVIGVLSAISALLTSYVFAVAMMSPYPPLHGTQEGGIIVVIVWTLLFAFVSYTKLCIAAVMRAQGGRALVSIGCGTQLGSGIGSVFIFALINYTTFFTQPENQPC